MQNLIVLVDPTEVFGSKENYFDCSLKANNMFVGRFCIDEDAAFELSGIHYLYQWSLTSKGHCIVRRIKEKGMEISVL